jgi:glycosyltransferase involved in cell wall biosynthesis
MTEFSVIIPVFNAESCLEQTTQKIVEAMDLMNKPYEIILIDDGSRDHSWEKIKQLKNTYSTVKGIRLNKNYGQHNVMLCGLNNCNGNYIITIDDDLEQNPKDIEQLYKIIIDKKIDVVYGIPAHVKKSFTRRLLTFVYKFTSRIENKNADKGSSFRIFTSKMKDNVVNHTGSLFFFR